MPRTVPSNPISGAIVAISSSGRNPPRRTASSCAARRVTSSRASWSGSSRALSAPAMNRRFDVPGCHDPLRFARRPCPGQGKRPELPQDDRQRQNGQNRNRGKGRTTGFKKLSCPRDIEPHDQCPGFSSSASSGIVLASKAALHRSSRALSPYNRRHCRNPLRSPARPVRVSGSDILSGS